MYRFLLSTLFGCSITLAHPAWAQTQTVEDIKNKYPKAKVVKVSPEEYEKYKRKLASDRHNPCLAEDYYESKAKSASLNVNEVDESWFDFNWTGSGGDKDFLVVVAVVGVVVVAALVVYSAGYLATMAVSGFDCRAWSDMGFRWSQITDSNQTQIRDGQLSGVYYSMGYRIPLGLVGLTAEVGSHDIGIEVIPAAQSVQIDGTYFLLGPSFNIPFGAIDGLAFQIELLAGTSTEDELGLMSTMRMGLNFPVTRQFNMGLNLGAALIDIKGFDSYINDRDNLNYLTGLSAAYRW